ncbi:MAG: aminotransferase class I/II-fold pyridoxal phosphate-dependent enzyme [Lachnospiraceae bacterium]|nr:aminotransferase class I/II-fold pyridoxal phosphate-dependent enzyme [Lachnospiraceae bacterium]
MKQIRSHNRPLYRDIAGDGNNGYTTLFDRLVSLSKSDMYPFHMPGHKRQSGRFNSFNPYDIDITEIDGFDDLNHPEGCILEAEKRAATLYGVKETHFLVNGCTAGILAAISACATGKKGILIGRNCHKAVYNAVMLNGLMPHYLWPGTTDVTDEMIQREDAVVSPEDVEKSLSENDDICAVVITSPTYEGYVSDIENIGKIVHRYGIPLIVDEAHGAHFPFHDIYPESSIYLGADIVIHGIHKTLPTLTQTALLHICTDRVFSDRVKKFLAVYQTSSPSYVLMGSIDNCMNYLITNGAKVYNAHASLLGNLYERLEGLKHIRIPSFGKVRDASKIVIGTEWLSIDGRQCYNLLRTRYGLQPEMAQIEHVVLMTSVFDTCEGYDRLVSALYDIDKEYGARGKEVAVTSATDADELGARGKTVAATSAEDAAVCNEDELGTGSPFVTDKKRFEYPRNKTVMSLKEAMLLPGVSTELRYSAGMMSTETVYVYPPGIPYIAAGELISRRCIEILEEYRNRGYDIKGLSDSEGRRILAYDICNNGQECHR